MNITSLFLAAVLLSLGSQAFGQATDAAKPDPNFHIYLCFGQSNMEGVNQIPAEEKVGIDPRFRVLAAVDFPQLDRKKGQWYDAVPPLCRGQTGLCPADYFGRAMVANLPKNVRVGVVVVAIGGCKIELFEQDHYQGYLKTAPDFVQNFSSEYGGNPYERLVAMARLAQKDGVIKGILLHQGESNANDQQWPSKVKGIYDSLMKDLGLKPDAVPLLAGETASAEFGGACAGMNQIIGKLPQTLPSAYVISSAGCPCQPDHLHFTVPGYRTLGTRYGEKMLSLEGIKMTAPATTPEK